MRLRVQGTGLFGAVAIGDGDARAQSDLLELLGVHHPFGLVEIVDDHDSGIGAQMQIPEHVTLGQGREQ